MEEFGNRFVINGCRRSLPRLCELKQNWGEWELYHMIINQDIRDESELALSLNSPLETWRYLCRRWQITSHQSRLMGAKDILSAWVFEAHSAAISIAAVSPLIRHERWQIFYESGLKHNTGLLWWLRRMISSDTSVVCSPECLSVLAAPACGLDRSPIRGDYASLSRDQAQSDSNPFKKNKNNNDLRCKLGLWGIWDYAGDLLARLWTDLLKMCWLYKCRGDAVRQCGPDQIRLVLILRGTSRFKQAATAKMKATARCDTLWKM